MYTINISEALILTINNSEALMKKIDNSEILHFFNDTPEPNDPKDALHEFCN